MLNNFDVEVFDHGWPVLIILVGVYLIYRHARKRSGVHSEYSDFRFIGDASHSGITGAIDGTSISHFIGDVDINLTGAQLKPGINNLRISVFIGDIEVFVPEGMAVEAHCSALFADLHFLDQKEGGIFLTVNRKTPGYDAAEKKVRINCNAFIGDIKIRQLKSA